MLNESLKRLLGMGRHQLAGRLPSDVSKALFALRPQTISAMSSRFFSGPSVEGKQHVVIALGGNALLKRKEEMTISNQRKNIREGMACLKRTLQNNAVTMVHGNGPVSSLKLQTTFSARRCQY